MMPNTSYDYLPTREEREEDAAVARLLAELHRGWTRDATSGAWLYAPVRDVVEDLLGTLAQEDDAEDAALELEDDDDA